MNQNRVSETQTLNLVEMRAIIARSKFWDSAFTILVLASMSVGLIVLSGPDFDLLQDGLPRLSLQFLTLFPSRKPEIAGVLSAWVGTALVMIVPLVSPFPSVSLRGSTSKNMPKRTGYRI